MLFVTSDWHLGHERIIPLCDRPFKDVNHMHEVLIANYNSRVDPLDDAFVLGDVAMGTFAETIKIVRRFNGDKYLVPGNHDRISGHESEARQARFLPMYMDVFFAVCDEVERVHLSSEVHPDAPVVNVSHYPYNGDSQREDRYDQLRPYDDGAVLLHGHTHSKEKISRSAKGSLQINIGVDAWDYFPASEAEILQLIRENR
jgi:calcineurin-like phosphoesterase family protein